MPIRVNILSYSGSGKGYYRVTQPYEYLQKYYNDFIITFFNNMPMNNENATHLVKTADIVVSHGILRQAPKSLPNILRKCKRFGKVSVYDIDDKDWEVPPENPTYHIFKREGLEDIYKDCIMAGDYITTTTTKLANELRQFNAKVEVLPNAIDYDYYYWNLPKEEDGYIRIGIITGSSHVFDLKLIEGLGKWCIDTFDNVKFVLGGYDSKILGKNLMGTRLLSYDDGPSNVWWVYKRLLFGKEPNWDKIEILRTEPIESYPILFKNVDIILAPLKYNKFNVVKSPLKIIEAGARGIPVIASDVWQYRENIVNGVDGFIVRTQNEWKKYITTLVTDEELRKKMGRSLNKRTREKYGIENVSKKRADFLRRIYTNVRQVTIQNEMINNYNLRKQILNKTVKENKNGEKNSTPHRIKFPKPM